MNTLTRVNKNRIEAGARVFVYLVLALPISVLLGIVCRSRGCIGTLSLIYS